MVDFRQSAISFAAFLSENPEFKMSSSDSLENELEAVPIVQMREALSKHVKAGLFITNRSPLKGEPFDDQWDHLQTVLAYKAVKDTLIRDHILVKGIELAEAAQATIDLMTVKRIFFDSYPIGLDSLLP